MTIRARPLIYPALLTLFLACAATGLPEAGTSQDPGQTRVATSRRVRPGISVLLSDSAHLIAGKRVGLVTNQSGIDERGTSTIDLLFRAGRLSALFSPEHGIRGTEDRTKVASERDSRTGLVVHSLYGTTVLPPPDSTLRDLDVLAVDLQDLGARPWTYVASMVYAMRSAARNRIRFIVLDRPNPITAGRTEGPVLDSAIAYAGSHSEARSASPVALYPIPLRHGLTIGELALFYNDVLQLGADLHVIPVEGWKRDMWFDETGLPWVKPSPNMPSVTSATLYPGLVAFEATNLSVGRGTPEAFQRLGAPWLDAPRVAELLEDRVLSGVRFEAERFTPSSPTDGKYAGVSLPGIRIVITDRGRLQTVRVGASVLWAIAKVHGDSLRVNERRFDMLFGSSAARSALMRGDDPDSVMDRELPATVAFQQKVRKYLLYR